MPRARVSVGSFRPIPPFLARDRHHSGLMKETFRTHLRPVGTKVYDIEDCRFIRLRYRQGSRCFLLYTLRLVERDTGHERDVQVTGLMYAQKNKAEQAWRKLQATDPQQEIPDGWLTFEPVSFVPSLNAGAGIPLRPSATDPSLLAGPPPELEPVLVAGSDLVTGASRRGTSSRPAADQGVVLRYTAKARNAAKGGERESFYARPTATKRESKLTERSARCGADRVPEKVSAW